MQHEPARRFEWEKLILRAEIDNALKTIALAAATYGNADGSSVGPSEARLAAEFDWSERYVRDLLTELRKLGLLEVTRKHSRHGSTVHQLTFPAAGVGSLGMRTDVNGYPWIGPRLPKKGGRKPKSPEPGVPVSEAEQGNSEFRCGPDSDAPTPEPGVPVEIQHRNWSSPTPELEFPNTGTPGSADHIDQTKTNPVVTTPQPPTSAVDQEPAQNDQGESGATVGDLDYARAARLLKLLSPLERDLLLSAAREQLTAAGIPLKVRSLTVAAASLREMRDSA